MATGWLTIRVDLVGGAHLGPEDRPGRVMLVGPEHTFAELAEAIDTAFARWDRAHLHEFELPDGRRIGIQDEDAPSEVEDGRAVEVLSAVQPSTEFTYVFDFGDDWMHQCLVQNEDADPLELFGAPPLEPVAVWGWGRIPDQYARTGPDG
jgi:pRiA4b ORF-3-like protein